MSKKLIVYIPEGHSASFTSDSLTSGTYVRLPNPGAPRNTPSSFSVSSSVQIGPFNSPYSYEFNYDGSDLSISISNDSVIEGLLPDVTELNQLDNINSLTSFTPRLDGISAAGEGTYSTQAGYYKQIGKIVYFHIELVWSAHTGTGNLKLAGLPVAAKTATKQYISGFPIGMSTTTDHIYGELDGATQEAPLFYINATAKTAVGMDTAGELYLNGFYMVD